MQTFVDIVTVIGWIVGGGALLFFLYVFYVTRKPRHGGPHSRSAR